MGRENRAARREAERAAFVVAVGKACHDRNIPDNCPPLVAAGADFIAVVSAVWECPEGPGVAEAAFNRAIAAV